MAFMTFDQDQAEKAGALHFTSGAYVGLMQAKHRVAKTGTKGFELSLLVSLNFFSQ